MPDPNAGVTQFSGHEEERGSVRLHDLELIEQSLDEHTQIFDLRGEVDAHGGAAIERRMTAAVEAGKTAIVIDLSGVTDIQRPMLSALLAGTMQLQRRRGRLALVCARPQFARIFHLTGFDSLLAIVPTRDAALRAVAAPA